MSAIVVTRMHAWTAAGMGVERLSEAVLGGAPLITPAFGGIAALTDAPDAETLLDEVVRAVLPSLPGRTGLVVGTTSGAISGAFEAWHEAGARPSHELPWRQLPTRTVAARHGLEPATTVSVACASSTAAFLVAEAWIRADRCDRVIVAGVDKLSPFIHRGFTSLGALGPRGARPFAADRDGLLLGEGAAAFLLEPSAHATSPALATLLATAITQDAFRITAPDPTGAGFARCVRDALRRAGIPVDRIDAASAHGTGTRQNDAAEARAWGSVFEGPVPLHAVKGVVGHCLGAAGAVELAVVLSGMNGASLPEPPASTELRMRAAGRVDTAISVNAAFGGVNAAVVLGRGTGPTLRERAPVRSFVHAFEAETLPLSEIWPEAPPALGRADLYVRAGVRALRELAVALAPMSPGDAIVLSSESNCRTADLRYYRGLLDGAGGARLHFPFTIPGAPLAEGSIAARLFGPALVLCDGQNAGSRLAHDLVQADLAPRVLSLHIEAPEDRRGVQVQCELYE